ncbi:MAG TPA: LysR family transcriptional regulator [Hyphomicrobiaceae bacterium]|nr:LysR family transcriptional regulator [Hyphomicrobiaceae bacterium]
MDLKRLRTFVTVAEEGTVSRAASRLNLTQPALSRQIHELQLELGLQLFDHVGRRLVLTSEGEQLLGESRDLLAQASALGERAQFLRHGNEGPLRVAASPVQIEAVLSTFLRRYAGRYPRVQMRLVEAVGPDIVTMLERGEVHLGLLLQAVRPDSPHFATYPVPPVELLAVCHRKFPVKRGNTIEVAQLTAHPLLLLDTGFLVRKTFDAFCRLAGTQPDILIESRAHSNLLALAEAGHGVAVIPSVVLTHRYALRVLRITHGGKPIREPLAVTWDRRRVLPKYAQDFCEMLAIHMRDLSKEAASATSGASGKHPRHPSALRAGRKRR